MENKQVLWPMETMTIQNTFCNFQLREHFLERENAKVAKTGDRSPTETLTFVLTQKVVWGPVHSESGHVHQARKIDSKGSYILSRYENGD